MPSYESINRAYAKDDLQMMQQAQVFHDLFVVDQLAFSTAFPKFLTPYETNFQTAIDDADAIPLDTTIAGEIVVKSAEIEAQMELARPALQKLFVYVSQAYNGDNSILQKFGKPLYETARKSPLKMKELLESAHYWANSTEHKAALLAAGYTQPAIDALDTIMDAIDLKNKEQEKMKFDRIAKTQERIQAYNDVWDFMMNISEASKVVYFDNPAKLQQYRLYPGESNLPGKVQNLTHPNSSNTFNWDVEPNSLSYELQFSINLPTPVWSTIYSGTANTAEFNPGTSGSWLFRVRGINDEGAGDWSDVLIVTR